MSCTTQPAPAPPRAAVSSCPGRTIALWACQSAACKSSMLTLSSCAKPRWIVGFAPGVRRARVTRHSDIFVGIKAIVCDTQLQQFCKGVIGSVIAYDPENRSRTLQMKLQVCLVPEQYRQQFKRGLKLELRGKLSLAQVEGIRGCRNNDYVSFQESRWSSVWRGSRTSP